MEKFIIALFHVSSNGKDKNPSLFYLEDGTVSPDPFYAYLFDKYDKISVVYLCSNNHIPVLLPATEDALEPILGADHDVTELLKHLYAKQNIPFHSHV